MSIDKRLNGLRFKKLTEKQKKILRVIDSYVSTEDGGPGSGNWGHKGRPNKRGGSGKGGGKKYRVEKEGGGYERKKLDDPTEMSEKYSNGKRSAFKSGNGQKFMPKGKIPTVPEKEPEKDPYVQNKNWLDEVGKDEDTFFAKAKRNGIMHQLGKFTRNNQVKQPYPSEDLVETCEKKLMEKGKYIDKLNYLLVKSQYIGFDDKIKQLQMDADVDFMKNNPGVPRGASVTSSIQIPNLTTEESKLFNDIAGRFGAWYNFNTRTVYTKILNDGSIEVEERVNLCNQFSNLLNKAMGGPIPEGYSSQKKETWKEPTPNDSYNVKESGDHYSETIASMRTPDRKYAQDQLKKAGEHTAKEVLAETQRLIESGEIGVVGLEKKVEEAETAAAAAREEYRKAVYKPIGQYSSAEVESAKKKMKKLEKEAEAARDAQDGAYAKAKSQALVNVLSRVRKVGLTPELQAKMGDHLPGNSSMKSVVQDAYSIYPTEWIEASMSKGSMKVGKIDRGHYDETTNEICISGGGDGGSFSTAVHELGHRMEYVFKDRIRSAEDAFYKSRTAGEPLTWLGGLYRKDELTRKDHFIDPYMGKDYKGKAFELVSMGFEMAATNPQKLHEDPDYEQFIYGLLALA